MSTCGRPYCSNKRLCTLCKPWLPGVLCRLVHGIDCRKCPEYLERAYPLTQALYRFATKQIHDPRRLFEIWTAVEGALGFDPLGTLQL